MTDTGPGTGGRTSCSACRSRKPMSGEDGSVRARASGTGGYRGKASREDGAGVTPGDLGSLRGARPDPPNSYFAPEDELPPEYMEEWYDEPAY